MGLLTACEGERADDGMTGLFAGSGSPPAIEKRLRETTLHGSVLIDEYAWLRDDNWQEILRDPGLLRADIRAHLEAENAYYESLTKGGEGLREALVAEMRGRLKADDSTPPAPDGSYAYYSRFRTGGEYRVFARLPRDGGPEEIIFDGDEESKDSAFFQIAAVRHSPDHKLVAIGVDRVGSEYYTIRIREIAGGKEFDEEIPNSSGEAVWTEKSNSFFYVERDENQRPKRVKHHVLGTDPSTDTTVYEEADDGFFVDLRKSRSRQFIFIDTGDQVTSEVHVLATGDVIPRMVAPRIPGQRYELHHNADHFYIRTNADGAVDFKIVRTPIETPGRRQWLDWLPHEPGTFVASVAAYAEHLVWLEWRNALPRIVVSDFAGQRHALAFDEAAYNLSLDAGYEYETATTRYVYASPAIPARTFDYDMTARARKLVKVQEIPSGHDPERYLVERVQVSGHDGVSIPLTILRLKSSPMDGNAPVLLYGYGSYGITVPAGFFSDILSLVDRGVIYAIAHVRGGAARGRQWYLDGKRDKKINTFKDFVSCAEALIAMGYTRKGRIVIYGRSAGGLLVGASLNLRPDLFAGVIAEVPFVDVLSTMSDPSLPLTPPEWPEWGNPISDPEAYGWIKSYSPYDNIAAVDYPPVLATGGLADYRVTYWEPAKWIARLRSDARGGPFLLRMDMGAGRAGAAARYKRLDERAHVFGFALKVLGVERKPS